MSIMREPEAQLTWNRVGIYMVVQLSEFCKMLRLSERGTGRVCTNKCSWSLKLRLDVEISRCLPRELSNAALLHWQTPANTPVGASISQCLVQKVAYRINDLQR